MRMLILASRDVMSREISKWNPIFVYPLTLLMVLIFFLNPPVVAQQTLDFDKDKLLIEISNQVKKHFYETTFDSVAWNRQVEDCRQQLAGITSLDQYDQKVNKLLTSLNASHTCFFTRNNPKRYQLLGVFNQIFDQGDTSLFCYQGIGIDTKTFEGKTFIISVYDGFSAAKAGLRFGDQIVSVDGHAFHPIESFRGKTNSKVRVELIRDNHPLTIEIPVVVLDGRTMFETALQSSMQIIEHNEKRIGYAAFMELCRRKVSGATS